MPAALSWPASTSPTPPPRPRSRSRSVSCTAGPMRGSSAPSGRLGVRAGHRLRDQRRRRPVHSPASAGSPHHSWSHARPDRVQPGVFACWQLLGVWARVEDALRQASNSAGKLSWQVSVDSTTARAHIHAAGARHDSVNRGAGEPDHHVLGRSRGGRGTKTHAAIDQHRGLLSFRLTPGQDGDSPQLIPVLDASRVTRSGPGRPRRRPDRVLADKAYSSRANRAWLRQHKIAATIPMPADQVGHRQR